MPLFGREVVGSTSRSGDGDIAMLQVVGLVGFRAGGPGM